MPMLMPVTGGNLPRQPARLLTMFDLSLLSLEEQDSTVTEVEVNEMLRLCNTLY
jgi:hypothetical protein